jgi:hypothetical protein
VSHSIAQHSSGPQQQCVCSLSTQIIPMVDYGCGVVIREALDLTATANPNRLQHSTGILGN